MGMRVIVFLAILATCAQVWAEEISGTVVQVIDGDTIVLDNGVHVRLLDIDTPEIHHDGTADEPIAKEAKIALEKIVQSKPVKVTSGKQTHDVYGRFLGQVYGPEGTWANAELVKGGYAHIYTFAENAMLADKLLPLEREARKSSKGIWALPRWQVREASTCCSAEDIGRYTLVQGKILNVKQTQDRVYFNFGKDWHSDFTFMVGKRELKWFKKAGIKDVASAYRGKEVLVRGFLEPINGAMIRVTHPAQLEVIQ